MALKRKLGFWDVFCIASGAMISSGLFVLPGQAYKLAGPGIVLAYALAGVMIVPALLSQVELATAMPRSGGSYFFVRRSMGALAGTLAGLSNWLSIALKAAFAMIGIGAFARLLLPAAEMTEAQWEWLIKGVAIACCLVFMALNLVSVKLAGRAQVVMVVGLLAALAGYMVLGVPSVRQHPNFDNFLAAGGANVWATAGLVFISYGGLTTVASIAEEVRQPGRNLPSAMIASCVLVSLLYVAAVLVTVGTLPAEELGAGPYGSLTPLTLSAGRFGGPAAAVVMSAAAILAFVTTGNSGILSASRNPLAMSRDGVLPAVLRRVSHRFHTPYVSILLTTAFMVSIIAVLRIGDLIKVASTMMLLLFVLGNVAVLIMRGSGIQNYRPLYRAPLFPWLQLAGIVVYTSLIAGLVAGLGAVPLATAGGFLALGTAWYFAYVRPRSNRESALAHMVRNVVAREIRRSELEEELRDIALERDEVVLDRFDHLVADGAVLDIPRAVGADEMFRQASEALAPRLGISAEALLDKLRAREAESSTVLQPGLAIPHVVVEGRGLFAVLLVRCREGISFAGAKEPVRTAFVLAGSADERNFHLRALMAIAHVVQEPHFTRRWLAAAGPEALRDVLLLSGRKRDAG